MIQPHVEVVYITPITKQTMYKWGMYHVFFHINDILSEIRSAATIVFLLC